MRKQISIALAAGLLAAGATAASAAGMNSTAKTKMAPPAVTTLNLTKAQQKTAWADLHSTAAQKAPSSFKAAVGQLLPSSIAIKPVTSKAAKDVPALKRYDFAMVKGKLLIVNPTSKKVAGVISG